MEHAKVNIGGEEDIGDDDEDEVIDETKCLLRWDVDRDSIASRCHHRSTVCQPSEET